MILVVPHVSLSCSDNFLIGIPALLYYFGIMTEAMSLLELILLLVEFGFLCSALDTRINPHEYV